MDENGVVKSRRRISRHSVKAASIMDIVVDTVDEDAAEDTGVEATVEMANQDVDAAAIEVVATHKQQCNKCLFTDPKSYWANLGFPYAVPKAFYDLLFQFHAGQKTACLIFFEEFSLLNWEIVPENWA